MSKTLYLIIFLSVLLIKSETSFSQELKKELGVCGKSLGAIFEVAKKSDTSLSTFTVREDEFCDNGRYEYNANYVIYLYNAKNQVVYDKYIYLNPFTISEEGDSKKGTFKKTKISKESGNSRIVNFPMTNEMGEIVAYKIKSLSNKKETEIKKIKWSL
jgi:hypothetical protein